MDIKKVVEENTMTKIKNVKPFLFPK